MELPVLEVSRLDKLGSNCICQTPWPTKSIISVSQTELCLGKSVKMLNCQEIALQFKSTSTSEPKVRIQTVMQPLQKRMRRKQDNSQRQTAPKVFNLKLCWQHMLIKPLVRKIFSKSTVQLASIFNLKITAVSLLKENQRLSRGRPLKICKLIIINN